MKPEVIKNYVSNNLLLQWDKVLKFFRAFYQHQHQLTSTTFPDRYPELFSEVKRVFQENSSIQNEVILSFGCSTGEECFSLRKYFSKATIVGVDINKINLRKATRANTDPRISFLHSNKENITTQGPYDIIFCLSVLCRWNDTELIDNCEDIYPFAKFDETVIHLSSHLKSGGLLVIYNSNFRFEDSTIFNLFRPIATPQITDSGFVHKFNKLNRKITEIHSAVLYQKK